jgi:hypothetical protein
MLLRHSVGRHVDGLWIGVWAPDASEFVLRRVEEALGLIKIYDRVRYDRLIRDLERVWVTPISGSSACFDHSIGACELDPRFVLAETSLPEKIAGVIVHEATHARLHRCGIGYEEDLRARVEAVCIRRELAFAARLPHGESLREEAGRILEQCANESLWTNAALGERHRIGDREILQYIGLPNWLVRTLLGLRAVQLIIWRFARRLTARQ